MLVLKELQKFDGLSEIPAILEEYTNKLAHSRKKVTAVNNLLTQVQERVNKLNTNTMRAAKKRQVLSLSPSLSPHPRVHVHACGRVPRFFLLIIGVRGVPVLDAFRKTFRNLQPRFASSKPMVLGPYTVLLLYADSQLCVYSMTSW